MRVKSFWLPKPRQSAVGMPILLDVSGDPPHKGRIARLDKDRVLIELDVPMDWHELEETGIGFDKFYDTVDD